MNCELCQERICQDGLAAAATARQHLADCPACREFQERMLALDAQLTSLAVMETLPPDFAQALLARLPDRLSVEEIVARRAQAEREHHAALAQLDLQFGLFWRTGKRARTRVWPQLNTWLRALELAVAWGVTGFLLFAALREWPLGVASALGLAALLLGLSRLPCWPALRYRFAL